MNKIQGAIDYPNATVREIMDILNNIIVLRNVDDEKYAILEDMLEYNFNDSNMNVAIQNILEVHHSQNDEIIDAVIQYRNSKIEDILKKTIEKEVKLILSEIGLSALTTGYEVGTLISTAVFGADAIAERYLMLKSCIQIEDSIRAATITAGIEFEDLGTVANARKFIAGIDMCLDIAYYSCDVVQGLAYSVCEDNLWSIIKNEFNLGTNNYEYYKKLVASEKELLDSYKSSLRKIWINYRTFYVDNKATTMREQEILTQTTEYLQEMKLYASAAVDESIILYDDITYEGDLYVKSDITLNGHTLTVKGDLVHEGGQIYIQGGSLKVNGNYVMAGRDQYGDYTSVSARLRACLASF